MAKLNMSPPWVLYYKKLNALFGEDERISIIYDEDNMEIKIYSTFADGADALLFLLPETVSFGNVELKIIVIPPNKTLGFKTTILNPTVAVTSLFYGNKHLDRIKTVYTPCGDFTYVIFKKEVIQYYEDNISDFYGNRSTLCEDIAREVFKDIEGVFFCTSIN